MKAGDICNHNVVTVSPEDSIRRAAELMRQHHVGDVVVADRGGGFLAPLGILTDRDIVVEVIAENVGLDGAQTAAISRPGDNLQPLSCWRTLGGKAHDPVRVPYRSRRNKPCVSPEPCFSPAF